MIDIKMLKGTGPYNQMKRYIESEHKDLTPQQRAGKFTALLKKFVLNANTYDAKNRPGAENKVRGLSTAFTWLQTPEGLLWQRINRFSDAPLVKQPKVKPPVKEQPAPVVGLVWPKGSTHYRPDLKRFFNEDGQWDVVGYMKWYKFMGDRTYAQWSALPQTIKRPETPLPNGEQWGEGYTHWTPGNNGRPFQFNDEGLFHPGKGHFEKWNPGFHEMHLKNCIARYPDNQPVILDMPPQAPVMPVQQRKAEPVPQAPVVENVAVKAPVEPPKAAPKKKVGWWA